VSDPVRAEAALRLAGERLLLSGGDRGYSGEGLGDVATALVLLCDLPQEVAEQVVADYGLARSLRGRWWPPHLRPGRRHVARGQQPSRPTPTPTPPTVVPCDTTVDLPDGRAHVRCVVFRDGACEVAASSAAVPGRAQHGGGRGASDRWVPEYTTVADDTGASTVGYFSGSGGEDGWEGRWQTDTSPPLSPHTQWLEIGGVRIELGAAAAPAPVRVEPLPDEPLVYRYLWHRAAVAGDWAPEEDLVLDVLVELGVLDPADPVLEELAAVTDATRQGWSGGTRPRVTRKPWASLLSRKRPDGPCGTVPVAAATPEFDGTVVVLYDLHAQPDGFELQARIEGDGAVSRSLNAEETGTPIAWWAEDDRGNSYLGRWGSHGGGGGERITGELGFHPGLHRKARHLTLLPTGLHHRAVIEVPLPKWGRP
jgi:hypothetical protein